MQHVRVGRLPPTPTPCDRSLGQEGPERACEQMGRAFNAFCQDLAFFCGRESGFQNGFKERRDDEKGLLWWPGGALLRWEPGMKLKTPEIEVGVPGEPLSSRSFQARQEVVAITEQVCGECGLNQQRLQGVRGGDWPGVSESHWRSGRGVGDVKDKGTGLAGEGGRLAFPEVGQATM